MKAVMEHGIQRDFRWLKKKSMRLEKVDWCFFFVFFFWVVKINTIMTEICLLYTTQQPNLAKQKLRIVQ